MVKAGSNTDIESLYKTICNRWEELELSEEEGDCAFIVFDLDNSESKIEKVETGEPIKYWEVDLSKLPFFEIGWPPMGPTHGHMNMSLRCHCDQIRRLSGYNNI